tara:strand:- start:30598 stop:31395 length:798 start_codon:yes stop_codon:yes gene_type:complete
MKLDKKRIKQLAKGEITLRNDGTKDQLKQILKAAFPEYTKHNNEYSGRWGFTSYDDLKWIYIAGESDKDIKGEVISAKDFFKESTKDKLKANLDAKVKDLFPELFEVKLEVGKWYKYTRSGTLSFYQGEGKKSYGFHTGHKFLDSHSWHMPTEDTEIIPATESEVKEALIKEAVKRGYKSGVKFVSLGEKFITDHCKGSVSVISDKPDYDLHFEDSILWVSGGENSGIIYEDGKWAEIIEEPKSITIEQAVKAIFEKHPGATVII